MHLSRLKIREFRNLRDFEITFTPSAKDADGAVRDFMSHAVIGKNGSGKIQYDRGHRDDLPRP